MVLTGPLHGEGGAGIGGRLGGGAIGEGEGATGIGRNADGVGIGVSTRLITSLLFTRAQVFNIRMKLNNWGLGRAVAFGTGAGGGLRKRTSGAISSCEKESLL